MQRYPIAQQLGQLAAEMQHQTDTETTLQAVVHGSVKLVPGARWAGISFIEGKDVTARAPTDPIVKTLDGLQTDLDEGPCLDALREHHTVVIDDMATEARWPRFGRAALDHGVRSMLSFRLFVRGNTMGALNLYATESGVFDDESLEVGAIVAQHASVALAAMAADAQFHRALDSRDLIGQAKGILMERFDLSALQAFQLLSRLSQESNTKVVDIARRLAETRGDDGTKPD